jgi:hypothetical protein
MATILDFVAMSCLTWTLFDHIGLDMDAEGDSLAISAASGPHARSSTRLRFPRCLVDVVALEQNSTREVIRDSAFSIGDLDMVTMPKGRSRQTSPTETALLDSASKKKRLSDPNSKEY